jgi:hypothetical protein
MTTATAPAPRAILEDRYDGLMLDGADPSKLQNRLDAVLADLAAGILRADPYADDADVQLDLDGLGAAIRTWFLDHAEGIAS